MQNFEVGTLAEHRGIDFITNNSGRASPSELWNIFTKHAEVMILNEQSDTKTGVDMLHTNSVP